MPKVLLVEDDNVQLRIREAVIRAAGFEVLTAPNAEEALPFLTDPHKTDFSNTISMIITDHLLPGINGVEFVRQVRAFDCAVPIVVLSGLPDAPDNYMGLNIIFRQKPCPPAELVSLVRQSFNPAA